jgi:hypothetical protein
MTDSRVWDLLISVISMSWFWATLDNRRVPGFGASHLRPNPRSTRISDTRQPLAVI